MKGILVDKLGFQTKKIEFEGVPELDKEIINFNKGALNISNPLDEENTNFCQYGLWVDYDSFEKLTNSDEFEVGAITNNFYKKASFDSEGKLVKYYGYKINIYFKKPIEFFKELTKELVDWIK